MRRLLSNILWAIGSRCTAWSVRLSRKRFGAIKITTPTYRYQVRAEYEPMRTMRDEGEIS